jgi:hypothetical protein
MAFRMFGYIATWKESLRGFVIVDSVKQGKTLQERAREREKRIYGEMVRKQKKDK